jgi:DNA-directed RNA polymerase subunit RPC12/RpoP
MALKRPVIESCNIRRRLKTKGFRGRLGTIMVELVDYKCADCGKIEQFRGDQNGISCKSCGGRIFMKLRRPGTKRIVAE